MKTVSEFIARRKPLANEFFPSPGSRRTVLVASHAPWTELMAYAVWQLGFNVLVAEPWTRFFGGDERFVKLDNVFRGWTQTLRKFKVQLVIGGDDAALLPHPKTKEPLHQAAGVPAVNFWSREPRATPAMSRRGYTAGDYLTCLRDSRTLNVFWDLDVMEEVRQFLAIPNVAHVPLATTPELWQAPATPVQERPVLLSFAGDYGPQHDWLRGHDQDTVAWAERVARLKLAEADRPMVACIEQVGGPGESRGSTARRPYELAPTLKDEFQRWAVLNGILTRDGRDALIKAAAARLASDFSLQGAGWEHLGISARAEPLDPAGRLALYARSRASLNPLEGNGTHAGLPFRAYEIACSGGLLLAQYTRELPGLFEPGRECVAFRNADEMLAALDRLRGSPQVFDAVVENGRRRAMSDHTWEQRMARVLELAKERFGLPW